MNKSTRQGCEKLFKILSWILDPPKPLLRTEIGSKFLRSECIDALSQALLRLGTTQSLSEAKMCWTEFLTTEQRFRCTLCGKNLMKNVSYKCMVCLDTILCRDCSGEYVTLKGYGKLSEGMETFELLESILYPYSYICQVPKFHPLFLKHTHTVSTFCSEIKIYGIFSPT